jgi:AraC-like DNA-binding protein
MSAIYVAAGCAQLLIQYCNEKLPGNGLTPPLNLDDEDPQSPLSLDFINAYIDLLLSSPSSPPHEWLIGEYIATNARALFTYALTSTNTLRESLALGDKYHRVMSNIAIRLDEEAPKGGLRRHVKVNGELTPQKGFIFNTVVALTIFSIDAVIQGSKSIEKIDLESNKFADLMFKIQKKLFLFDIHYSPVEFSMLFTAKMLDLQMKDSNEGIKEVLVKELEQKLKNIPENYSWKDQVSAHIRAELSHNVDVESTCERFFLTRRTLGRYLEKDNTSFSKLLNTIRKEKAMQLMQDFNIPIKKVAALSGFNSLPHFNSCFKKWTGITPATYRKQMH